MRFRTTYGLALALGAMLLVATGCTTTDSDMPWNTPQSWEGSPSFPGFSSDSGMGN